MQRIANGTGETPRRRLRQEPRSDAATALENSILLQQAQRLAHRSATDPEFRTKLLLRGETSSLGARSEGQCDLVIKRDALAERNG
jgi:hypothetical protein